MTDQTLIEQNNELRKALTKIMVAALPFSRSSGQLCTRLHRAMVSANKALAKVPKGDK